MAPSQDGERAERLTNTLFGAKDGGRHRQERALVLRVCVARCDVAPELRFYWRVDGLLTRKAMILSWLSRNIVSDDANASTPRRAPDDGVLQFWRRVA